MKTKVCLVAIGLFLACAAWSASGINYDGTNLELNNDFTRTECGTQKKDVMKEISGMACSRVTPGYIWEHGDENLNSNRRILAIKPDGTQQMEVKVSTSSDRDDWEDICTGTYGGKNYIFIGAIGDNNLEYKDKYYIYYFEEPAITSGSKTITASEIVFGYPDNQAHNTETLMYDNVEQVFYIATKADGVCSLYSLPFKTDYSGKQTLTKVCDLGNGSKFNLCTGGDITPDGSWMAIKNKKYILLWERQGSESLSATATRRPTQIAAYQEEKQGESLAWEDNSTFYTTSDQKKDVPIYKYTRGDSPIVPPDTTQTDTVPEDPQVTPPALYEVIMSNAYSAYVDGSDLKAFYLAGSEEPTISAYKVNEGTKWEQNGNTITLTGSDETTISYTLVTKAVTPVAFTDQEIVFDGSADEAEWLKAAYGWDDTKKWRFSKTDDDYSREIAGKTHIELFLPACDTVVLTSMKTERDVRIYVNGAQLGDKVKLVKTGLALAVEQSAPFMLSVVSAQSSGDGGIAAIRMARKATPTGIDETASEKASTKVLYNGRLFILRGTKIYTPAGQQVR
jgi:hypothetical protein